MVTRRHDGELWRQTESGVLIPSGRASDLSLSSSQTYLRIKEAAKAIEQLYANNGIELPPGSELVRLIEHVKTLSDSWLTNQEDNITKDVLASAAFLNRFSNAVISLADVPHRTHFLRALLVGNLDVHQRTPSHAKDILWEIELWGILRSRGFMTDLQEPPDIVVHFEDARIGIACKKLYSEQNVGKILSQAVNQIETTFDYGIVALSLDDLLAPSQILLSKTQEQMGDFLNRLNESFLRKHGRHLRRYLLPGRVLSVLVSTSTLADVSAERVRFNIARQSTVMTFAGLPEEKKKQLQRFYVQLMH